LTGGTEDQARELIASHKAVYRRYWEWSKATGRAARAAGVMHSVFGWRLNVRQDTKAGTIRNFPLQANGAEILRLACCLLVREGVRVCAPVHDAVLIEAPLGEIDEVVETCRRTMSEAAETVLGGFPLRTDVKVVRYPDRYMEERGRPSWEWVMGQEGT
jgi:DNA polymerase-1